MVPQNMIDNSNIFGNISLKKRSLLMMPSFLFDDIISKMVSDQQIIQQSCEPVNYLIIIIISWWVLLARFQLYVMSGTWDTRGEAYMFLNWNYCYLSHSVLLLSWSNSNDKKHKRSYHTKTMTAQNLMKWVT